MKKHLQIPVYPAVLIVLAAFLITSKAGAQTNINIFQEGNQISLNDPQARVQARVGVVMDLSANVLDGATDIFAEGVQIYLPDETGSLDAYRITSNGVLPETLKAKFPAIHTANVESIANKGRYGKVSLTPQGFHAMIFEPGGSALYIDPLFEDNNVEHLVYRKKDFLTNKAFQCFAALEDDGDHIQHFGQSRSSNDYRSCELRTYNIIISATGEYTIFHGGTVESAMAAIAVSLNRVNGIYERDFGVTFELNDNNELVVFTDPASDPFSNGDAFAMLQENQNLLVSTFGINGWDIGHVFGTNSGGVASLGSVCNANSKGRGVTGSFFPIGDPFDIDYVCHEIGHQFGARHTYNNFCGGNRSDATAAEPGSGTTIMAYAGICTPDIQFNSDDHFHGLSLAEAGNFVTAVTCGTLTQVNNNSPVIGDLPDDIFVPVQTPFFLNADVTDPENDPMSYCWEQIDVEISNQPPVATATQGPNFRSVRPNVSSTRYFPNLVAQVFTSDFTWERLPSVERSMNFRLSVRDNNAELGCTQYSDLPVNFVNTSGQFALTYPNTQGIVWPALSFQTVTWNVGGTDLPPVSATEVDILMAFTNALNFDTILVATVPNNGSHVIQVPNVNTNFARVMVRASGGYFFNLSRFPISIPGIENGFAFLPEQSNATACQGTQITFNLGTIVVGNLEEDEIALEVTNLPEGIEASFSEQVIAEGEQTVLTLQISDNAPVGTIGLVVQGQSGSFANTTTLQVVVLDADLEAAPLLLPEDQQTEVSVNPVLQWEANAGPGGTYQLQLASDADFNEIIISESGIESNSFMLDGLEPESTYFWRIASQNECDTSPYDTPFSFETIACSFGTNNNVTALGNTFDGIVQSNIPIAAEGVVSEIDFVRVSGSHDEVSQLYFSVESPDGVSVGLGGVACGIDLSLLPNQTIELTDHLGNVTSFPTGPSAPWGANLTSVGLTAKAVQGFDINQFGPEVFCEMPANSALLAGKIVIVWRGDCTFIEKAEMVQEAGGIGMVVINNSGDNVIPLGGQGNVPFPAVMVGQSAGLAILAALGALPSDFDITFSNIAQPDQATCGAASTQLPDEPLSNLVGQLAEGNWKLKVQHSGIEGSGSLDTWALGLCRGSGLVSTQTSSVKNNFDIYPNPAGESVQVQWSGADQYTDLHMYDLAGRQVHSTKIVGSHMVMLPLGEFQQGVYFITLRGDGRQATQKLVLSR